MTKRLITTEEKQRMQELRDQGWSYARIAREFGRVHTTVRLILDPSAREADLKRGKAYREANKEYIKEYSKAWWDANKEHTKEYREANKEHIKERNKAYREANKERLREYIKTYRETNKERIAKYNAAYQETNKERIKEYTKEYHKSPKGRASSARFKATRKRQIAKYKPTQSEKIAIDQIRINVPDGHHVDHIYPLAKGGLEHPWNLQHLTAEENIAKKDKVMPNTPPLVELVPGGFIPLPDFLI